MLPLAVCVKGAASIPVTTRKGGRCQQSAQRSSQGHRAASGWRSPGCWARRASASRWPPGARRSSRAPSPGSRPDGFDVQAVAANVAEEAEIQKVVAAHRERYGRLDVLVNNAGVGIGAPVGEIQTKHLDMQLAVNLRSIVLFYRECLSMLQERPASTATRSSSTPPRSPASADRPGCRSTPPPSTASSAGRKR